MSYINLILFASFVMAAALELNQLNVGVWLSGAAYCGKEQYKTMTIIGPAEGFVYKDTLYDEKTDLQGYIGTLASTKTIYVVFRGSSSTMNWLDDFEVRHVPYTTYPECDCKVHHGFYRSALGVSNKTAEVVKSLQKNYPGYSVVVTGHSYGASCAQLIAMEMERKGIHVKLYDYGQPRVGDKKYAAFVGKVLSEYYRTTHNKDLVPHMPPIDGLGYHHSCREVFEDATGKTTLCSETNCEDPNCSDQYSLVHTSTEDHLYYLRHRMSCEESTEPTRLICL